MSGRRTAAEALMGFVGNYEEDARRIIDKLGGFFDGMHEDLELAGEAGAEAIVRTTLAGIGERDAPFAPYSRVYQQVVDSVGGKPQQTVNLRGLFYHDGQKRKRYRSERRRQLEREGRRAYIRITFASRALNLGGAGEAFSFQARTQVTRPALGVRDPRSEMSLDLIKVSATDRKLTLIYEPRDKAYMVWHQEGKVRGAAKRVWFTADKRAVWAGMLSVIKLALRARAAQFNGETEEAPAGA